jgi:hypothetical protein
LIVGDAALLSKSFSRSPNAISVASDPLHQMLQRFQQAQHASGEFIFHSGGHVRKHFAREEHAHDAPIGISIESAAGWG